MSHEDNYVLNMLYLKSCTDMQSYWSYNKVQRQWQVNKALQNPSLQDLPHHFLLPHSFRFIGSTVSLMEDTDLLQPPVFSMSTLLPGALSSRYVQVCALASLKWASHQSSTPSLLQSVPCRVLVFFIKLFCFVFKREGRVSLGSTSHPRILCRPGWPWTEVHLPLLSEH